ncbi:hypothetical protein [Flavobacterium sp. HNIBRBA15423]|uniref:hypothetical protein n=1 Tax=Flavobacterium sp. HNIBRBA15423 TaxID=3458683 RepID=UPI004044C2E2
MSNELKKTVLNFLQNLPENPSDQFNKLFEFYRKSDRKQRAMELSYNRRGYSDQNLKNLLYDVKKVYDISDIEVLTVKKVEAEKEIKINAIPDYILDMSEEELRAWAKLEVTVPGDGIKEVIELAEKQGFEEIVKILAEELEALSFIDNKDDKGNGENLGIIDQENDKVLKNESKYENETIALRTEFPFLNNPNCPEKLFVVVGKRISAYRTYQELHQKLVTIEAGEVTIPEEEKLELIKICDAAFNENQALWNELNHYATTGEILGKHPLFREDNIKNEVDLMSAEDMFKFKNASSKYFSVQKKELVKHMNDPAKIELINERIADREFKLALVNAKMGVNAKE